MPPSTKEEASNISVDYVNFLNSLENVVADKYNSHFKSKYASLAEILSAVKPVAKANNFAISQPLNSGGENVLIISTRLFHKSGQSIDISATPINTAGLNPQQIGSAIKYACRYQIQSAFCIGVELEDDDGNSASQPSPVASRGASTYVPKWHDFILHKEKDAAKAYLVGKAYIKEEHTLDDLPLAHINRIIANKQAFLEIIRATK